jgi:hypothetical protein
MSGYRDFITRSTPIVVKDPSQHVKYQWHLMGEKQEWIGKIDHYLKQGTIPKEEAERFKAMIESPDNENMELVKVILDTKYKIV